MKIKEGYIDQYELWGLLVNLIGINALLGLPRVLTQDAFSAGWLEVIISGLAGMVGFYIIYRLLRLFPGRDLIEISRMVWGNWLGSLVGLCFIIYFLVLNFITLRLFAEAILSTALPQTPISVVIALFLIGALMAAYFGLEVIGRANWLLQPFLFFVFLVITSGLLNQINFNTLFPILGPGIIPLFKTSLLRSAFFGQILAIGFIAPYIRKPPTIAKAGVAAISSVVIVFAWLQMVYTGFFRVSTGEKILTPFYQMAREINFGRFFQRIESVFIFIYYFSGVLFYAITLYLVASGLARLCRVPIYQPLLFPLVIIVFTLALIPPSATSMSMIWAEYFFKWSWAVAFGLPALILVTAYLRSLKKEKQHAPAAS